MMEGIDIEFEEDLPIPTDRENMTPEEKEADLRAKVINFTKLADRNYARRGKLMKKRLKNLPEWFYDSMGNRIYYDLDGNQLQVDSDSGAPYRMVDELVPIESEDQELYSENDPFIKVDEHGEKFMVHRKPQFVDDEDMLHPLEPEDNVEDDELLDDEVVESDPDEDADYVVVMNEDRRKLQAAIEAAELLVKQEEEKR